AGRFDEAEQVRAQYLGMEDCRDEISPIRVLHDAVTLAGVADMGPMLPLVTGLSEQDRQRVAPAARALLQWDTEVVPAWSGKPAIDGGRRKVFPRRAFSRA